MSVSNRSSIPMSLLGTYSLGCVALCLSILCLIATKRFGNGWRRCKKTDTVGSKNSADAARPDGQVHRRTNRPKLESRKRCVNSGR